MYKGFYSYYCELDDENKNDGFLKILDDIDVEILVKNTGDIISVSVASFLLGFCYHLASFLSYNYGYSQKLIIDKEGFLIHSYCEYIKDGKKYYIDSRGITDDEDMFFSLFEDSMSDCTFSDVKDINKEEFEKNNFIIFDDISDIMIDWLISNFDYYNVNNEESL